jgi:hypothetical protein
MALLILALPCVSIGENQSTTRDFGGLMYKCAFSGSVRDCEALLGDKQKLQASERRRLEEYVSRRKSFRSKLIEPKDMTFPADEGFREKQWLEGAIVSLVDAPGIEETAADYASKAKLYYEWEGLSEGPLTEAQFAETYLSANPATPIKPYLLLFLLHRYRCAYECLDFEKNLAERAKAAQKYQLYLKEARQHPDPLIGLVADDIDRAPYLYIKTEEHP